MGSLATGLLLMFSNDSFFSVKTSFNLRNSYEARSLINACAEVALEIIRENNDYTTINNTVNLSNNICTYTISNVGGNNRSIAIQGTIKNMTRKLLITTDAFNPLGISSWQEIE